MGKRIIINGADFSKYKVNIPVYYYKALREHNYDAGSQINLTNAGFGLNRLFCESVVGQPINFIEFIPKRNSANGLKIYKTDSTYSETELLTTISVDDEDLNKLKRYYFDTITLNDGEYLGLGDSSSMVDIGYYPDDMGYGGIIEFNKFPYNTTSYGSINEDVTYFGYNAPINIGYYEAN